MSTHDDVVFLLSLAVLVAAALGLGRLAGRAGLPAVAGELVAGVLLGPTVLGHLAPGLSGWLFPTRTGVGGPVDPVALLGSVMLVGLTGAHLDLRLLRGRARAAAWVGTAGLAVPLACGVAVGLGLPAVLRGPNATPAVFAAFIGTALCASAIPVISKTLADMRLLHRDVGQLTLAAVMVDDALAWIGLSVVAALAAHGAVAGRVGQALAFLAGIVVFAAVLGRPLVRAAFRAAARADGPGPATAVGFGVVLLCASATAALGLEPVFGAFVGGILIATAGPEARQPLAALRTVVMAVLAPVFLASAGLKIDLTVLRRPEVLAAAALVLAVAVVTKFVGADLGGRFCRLDRWERVALGAGMNSRGVVEIVIATTGLRLGVVSRSGFTVIVLIAICTSLLAPPILRHSAARMTETDEERMRLWEMEAEVGSSRPVAAAAAIPVDEPLDVF